VAAVTMVLGIIGVIVIAIAASRVEGYYGEETNVGVLVGWLLGGLLGLMLSLGFFFMGARIMEGLAELIVLNRPHALRATDGARSQAQAAAPAEVEWTPFAPVAGRRWQVCRPGAWLRRSADSDDKVWLPFGTGVVERERKGGSLNVTAPDGQTGWLERVEVRSPEEPLPPA
jgi:hypothetical protein